MRNVEYLKKSTSDIFVFIVYSQNKMQDKTTQESWYSSFGFISSKLVQWGYFWMILKLAADQLPEILTKYWFPNISFDGNILHSSAFFLEGKAKTNKLQSLRCSSGQDVFINV